MKSIRNAILSVSDKTGLIELAKALIEQNIALYSTGGTLKTLLEAKIQATSIETYTDFPEMLDGRLKTLHPKIYAGILGIRSNKQHVKSMNEHNVIPFDLLIINLYPFEKIIKSKDVLLEKVIENIDIGGPSMIRAAAKNYNDVAVLVQPSQYPELITKLKDGKGRLSEQYRFQLMLDAFNHTALYDANIALYFNRLQKNDFPIKVALLMQKKQSMRYGENPHQKSAFYLPALSSCLPWKQLNGKELSYNNILDIDSALAIMAEFSNPMVAILKHNNPCGIAIAASAIEKQEKTLRRALASDPISFFGGIIVFNRKVTLSAAEEISQHFFEIIIAPEFSKKAFLLLSKKKNIRLLEVIKPDSSTESIQEIRSSVSGFLIQDKDQIKIQEKDFNIVSHVKPNKVLMKELVFAFQLVKHIKSNAIVFVKNFQSIGIGAGQMSRIDSIELAKFKAEKAGFSLEGSIVASDAFFPFRDGIDMAIKSGVEAIIQPGGSIRDQECIDAVNESKVTMVFTGTRHFRH